MTRMWWNFVLLTFCVPVLAFSAPAIKAGGTEDVEGAERQQALTIVPFIRFESPEDFVRRWPEQKRRFEGLSRPYSPKQTRVLNTAYYPYTTAGRLLEQLGEVAFLKELGGGTVEHMRKATVAEEKQRKAAESKQEAAECVDGAGWSISDIIRQFVKPRTPMHFVEYWPRQKRLAQSIAGPLSPEQNRIINSAHYDFTAAGQLLEEFGKKAFLKKYGEGTVAQMKKAAMTELQKRKATGKILNQPTVHNADGSIERNNSDGGMFASSPPSTRGKRKKAGAEKEASAGGLSSKSLFPTERKAQCRKSDDRSRAGVADYVLKNGAASMPITNQVDLPHFVDSPRHTYSAPTTSVPDDTCAPTTVSHHVALEAVEHYPERLDKDSAAAPDQAETYPSEKLYHAPSVPGSDYGLLEAQYEMVGEEFFAEWDPMGEAYGLPSLCGWQGDEEAGEEDLAPVPALGQAGKSSTARLSQGNQTATVRDQTKGSPSLASFRHAPLPSFPCGEDSTAEQLNNDAMGMRGQAEEQHVSDSPNQSVGVDNVKHSSVAATDNVTMEGLLAERAQLKELHELSSSYEWPDGKETEQGSGQCPEQVNGGSTTRPSDQEITAIGEELLGAAKFVRPTSPGDFVRRWPKQKRLFESLPYPQKPEQEHILMRTYYPFMPAGQLLEELGEEAFLQEFGAGTVTDLQEMAVAVLQRRRAVEKAQRRRVAAETVSVANLEVAKVEQALGTVTQNGGRQATESAKAKARKSAIRIIECYSSSEDAAVEIEDTQCARGPAQDQTEERYLTNGSHSPPLSLEQQDTKGTSQESASASTSGQADDENVTLQPEESNEGTVGARTAGKTLGIVQFAKPESPKDFVKRWPEQKRLFESLSRPISPEQKRVLRSSYYKFAAAGRLLEELGEEAFLKTYGKSTIAYMRRTVAAEMQQRKKVKERQKESEEIEKIEKSEESKEIEESEESREIKESEETEGPEEIEESEGIKESEESKEIEKFEELREIKESEEIKEIEKSEELREIKESEESKESEEIKESEESNEAEESQKVEAAENLENRDPGMVKFVRPKSPKEFVKRWPEQKHLFKSLEPLYSPEQKLILCHNYYLFTTSGQLLEELGEETFLKKLGNGSVEQMRKAAVAEMKKRRAAERDRELAGEMSEAEEANASGIVVFVRPKSPKGFVKRWPEQKRLFESLQRPYSFEQRRVLSSTYYQFTAAGQLLEELGEAAFLQKFGKGSVEKMREATRAEIKQRGAAERDREVAGVASDAEEENASGTVIFVRPKSPKGFVKRWPEQKRFFESLQRPYSPEQKRALCVYYKFRAAGQLLEEFGAKEFLQRFGNGSVEQMRKTAATERKKRRATERARGAAGDLSDAEEENASGTVQFVRPKSPREFVKHWPAQKRLFGSLQCPYSSEQKRILDLHHYPFTAAGQLLKELGREAFLQKFGMGSVEKMLKATRAEKKQRKMIEREQDAAGDVSDTEEENASSTVAFVRPKSPKGFVKHWPRQKRLFESLQRPYSPKQRQALNIYYQFVAAGQLLEELGEEVFLQKFGESSVKQMQKATVIEMKQRKATERDQKAARDVSDAEEANASGIETFVWPKSPKSFVKRWPGQKRLFESLQRPCSPEQTRILMSVYYPFTAAGQLLEELGEEAFLQKFNGSSVKKMQKTARDEMKQRKAEKEPIPLEDIENQIAALAAFVDSKAPKDFVKHWPEQKRLAESIPRSLTPKQMRVLDRAYYKLTAAGRLLDELGAKTFLEKFGKSSLTQMKKAVAAEMKQRKTEGKIKEKVEGKVKGKDAKRLAKESTKTKKGARTCKDDKTGSASAKGRKKPKRHSKKSESESDDPLDSSYSAD